MKFLFICRGNVGRSQIAEALCQKKIAETAHDPDIVYEVESAGTQLSGKEQPLGELRPATDNVIEVMQEIGIDISGHIRKQVTESMAQSADQIILVVDEHDPLPEYLLDSPKILKWHIPDPKGQSLEFTRETRNQIKELIDTIEL